ncbi:hypothetical protein [Bradyrhizobium japonicum]|uniref:hypothetical protein n=1 Tax=Bradyrhizobium japonicum TaxID=375 RepID=UPI001E3BFE56|nr:hypothetical protein [Bradyrhizobium japonicum]MCD9825247.1 hypothetical protein [Bradyrhizobium japonicum]MCD9898265.1 hypothetical protein [Bradyrhizobium japonicum]MEB2671244.1 hypothetical protein [Bradyrhizobium japonicum]WLB28526.1 hypothetical protein QIH85_43145 [Bradyrhizobium japonicum]WRI90558.1 hypothetical protein R3F75_06425 [Bradyrhizobium japonicum]
MREQFDIAHPPLPWFVREFTMLAERHCYSVLEMALRRRINPEALPDTIKDPGLLSWFRMPSTADFFGASV